MAIHEDANGVRSITTNSTPTPDSVKNRNGRELTVAVEVLA